MTKNQIGSYQNELGKCQFTRSKGVIYHFFIRSWGRPCSQKVPVLIALINKFSAFFQGPDKPLPPVPGGGMGGTTPPPPPVPGGHMRTGSMNDLDRKNAIEVMELSDIHHPSCKLSQSRQGSFDDDADDGKFFFEDTMIWHDFWLIHRWDSIFMSTYYDFQKKAVGGAIKFWDTLWLSCNVWFKKTWTNHSSDRVLQFFFNQTLTVWDPCHPILNPIPTGNGLKGVPA